jgi:hypothetical protein
MEGAFRDIEAAGEDSEIGTAQPGSGCSTVAVSWAKRRLLAHHFAFTFYLQIRAFGVEPGGIEPPPSAVQRRLDKFTNVRGCSENRLFQPVFDCD